MNFIVPILYFLFATATVVFLTHKTFGKALVLTMLGSAFSLFLGQMVFHTFLVGYYINILFALFSFILLLIYRKNKKKLKEFKKNYFSAGFFAFLIIYSMFFLFDLNRTYTQWDERSHWGVMIKEMLRLDKFYSISSSTLMVHKDYPPLLQLFELFWCQLSGGYKESFVLTGLHVLEFSLFIPFLSELKIIKTKRKFIVSIVTIVGIIFLLLLLFDQHAIINTIYNDYFMAILVAYLIAIIVIEKEPLNLFHLISLSIGSSFLLLTKQMGFPLYLLVLFVFVGDFIIKYKARIVSNIPQEKRQKGIVIIKICCLLLFIPLLLWSGWNQYVSNLEVEKQFSLQSIKLEQLPFIFIGTKGESYQQETIQNYFDAIRMRNLTTSEIVPLSYFQGLVLALLLLYSIGSFGKMYFLKRQILFLGVSLTLGALGYALVMLLLYVFSFGSSEGSQLASFDRYMDTFLLLALFVVVMLFLFLYFKEEQRDYSFLCLIFCVLFLLTAPTKLEHVTPCLISPQKTVYQEKASQIITKVKGDSKVFVLAQNSIGDYQYYIKYYANPILTNLKFFSWPTALSQDDVKNYFEKELKNYLLTYEYFYIAKLDPDFVDAYNFLFASTDLEEGQIYSINKNGNEVFFQLM